GEAYHVLLAPCGRATELRTRCGSSGRHRFVAIPGQSWPAATFAALMCAKISAVGSAAAAGSAASDGMEASATLPTRADPTPADHLNFGPMLHLPHILVLPPASAGLRYQPFTISAFRLAR